MTLIVTVNGPETIWLLADRRLSYGAAHPPRDDARKLMMLETTDGVAILGYAGLGATSQETEPSDWMSNVLRGRNISLEQSLDVLAGAAKDQIPGHIVNRIPGHSIVATSFVGEEPRLYTIDLAFSPDRKAFHFRYTRHFVGDPTAGFTSGNGRTPRTTVAGSGQVHLRRNQQWIRRLQSLANAHDRGRISPLAVSDYLAKINRNVQLGTTDGSVGPCCIVAWRYKKDGVHGGGGGQQFYTQTTRDRSSPSLPSITRGRDLTALIQAIAPQTTKHLQAMLSGEAPPEIDIDEISAKLAQLPDKPDENLR